MITRIHRKRRVLLGLLTAVVLVAAGTAAARAMTSSGGPRYRTAAVAIGSVDQQLNGVGSLSAVNRVSVAFPVAGTVASVPVSVGSRVSVGQVLARLSPTALNQALNTADASLASAKQTLATDQASQTESTASESVDIESADIESADTVSAIVLTAAVTPRPTTSAAPKPAGGNLTQLITQVTAGQKAVLAAQQELDHDLSAAETALATCQNALNLPVSPPPVSPPPASTAPASSPPASTAGSGATAGADEGSATCLAAIAAAPSKADAARAQQTRDDAERSLDSAVHALEQAARRAAASGGKSTGGGSSAPGSRPSAGTGTGNSGSNGAGSSSAARSTGRTGTGSDPSSSSGIGSGTGAASSGARNNPTSGPASAAQLAADQAQIDAAQAQLVVARQNLAAAVLTSPVTGTVGAVSITAGKNASSSATITIIGTGQSQVSTTVGLADIDKVKVGDPATVKVDGVSQMLSGKVSLIGILNTTSGSSTSYPVTILLDPTSQKLYDGSGASTQIQIAQVAGVLTVPSSAVRSIGQFSTVTVLSNGKAQTTRVTVGAVGNDRTQILTGLTAGQQVVLANLSQKLPTSSS